MTRSNRLRLVPVSFVLVLSAFTSLFAPAAGMGFPSTVAIECAEPASVPAAGATPPVEDNVGVVPFPEGGGELTVFAAASLTDSFNTIKTLLESENPGLAITYNFAGSQALVTQLAEGAAADVVALASSGQMNAAIEQDLVAGEPEIFAKNELAIVVPADNPGAVQSAADLSKEGLKLVLALPEVPVGQYGRESICKMGADTVTYGEDFVAAVGANVVSEEDNVKSVLTKVQLGEADAGIVYITDITAEVAADVEVIEIPESVNVLASYPVALTKEGNVELGGAFISFLLGSAGQSILAESGFIAP